MAGRAHLALAGRVMPEDLFDRGGGPIALK